MSHTLKTLTNFTPQINKAQFKKICIFYHAILKHKILGAMTAHPHSVIRAKVEYRHKLNLKQPDL